MAKRTTVRDTANTGTDVQELLAKIEKNLETPVVSGELASWLSVVLESTEALLPRLREHYEQAHAVQLADMGEQDGGLLPRVEQLQQEDQEILAQGDQLIAYIRALQQRLAESETGETEMHDEQQELSAVGITWVVRARTQEAAMETWFNEAFERDRGVVD